MAGAAGDIPIDYPAQRHTLGAGGRGEPVAMVGRYQAVEALASPSIRACAIAKDRLDRRTLSEVERRRECRLAGL